MNVVLAVFLGGGLGSVTRYGVTKFVMEIWNGKFPAGTLIANILSCVIMGLVLGVLAQRLTSQELRAFVLIGFCGGFSTFSTFSLESLILIQTGNYAVAIANVLLSVLTCLFLLWWLVPVKEIF